MSNYKLFFKLFTESLWNKGQIKKKRERGMMRITVWFASSDNSGIAKPKLEGLSLSIRWFFEKSYAVDTHQKI